MVNKADILGYIDSTMEAERLRQKTIANNLANLNTPGYRRQDVKFEEQLAAAMDSGRPVDPSQIQPEIFLPLTTPVSPNGNDVDVDMEVGELIKHSGKLKACLRLAGRLYQQMSLAINSQA